MENKPFIFGVATSGDNFTDREKETERLLLNFRHGVNTVLISPRRWGKTSLVQKVCRLAQSDKLKVVYLDIFSCRSDKDFYDAFAAAVLKQTSSKLDEWLENAKLFLSRISPKISMGTDPITDFSISLEMNPKSNDVDEIVNTIYLISGSFGGVNLEDISAPRCFEIEKKLKEKCDIPIFHDDQHGTAIITLAGLTNALKVVGKKKENVRIVMNGAGAAAISIARLLLTAGFKDITLCDRKGAIYEGRPEGMNPVKDEMAKVTNLAKKSGSLADMLVGADVFIGVSAPGAVTTEMVKTMNKDAVVFACANPIPEIFPDDAKAGGAKVVSTGRSDFPNQINNVLAFPGIFRGAFDVRAKEINDEMKLAAAEALAGLITDEELSSEYIIPKAFDKRVGKAVAKAVADAARETGVARL